tara:strand:+ start:232 stop:378 length:147 start_codon:yes stop_codon:yes gene_type:complete
MDIEKRTQNAFKIGQALGLAKQILYYSTGDINKRQLEDLIQKLDNIEL